jgi:acyl-CoA thioesterase-1
VAHSEKAEGDTTIVFLGDSITEAPDGYVRLVTDVLQAVRPERWTHTVNAGVGGARSVDLPPRLRRDVLVHHPDIVTVSIGVNDVWRALDAPGLGQDVPLPVYRQAVADVLDTIGAAGARAIVVTTSVIGEDLHSEDLHSEGNRLLAPYNDALRELAAARGLTVAEVNEAFQRVLAAPHPPQLTTDGVHLTHQGNVVLALPVLRALGVEINAR